MKKIHYLIIKHYPRVLGVLMGAVGIVGCHELGWRAAPDLWIAAAIFGCVILLSAMIIGMAIFNIKDVPALRRKICENTKTKIRIKGHYFHNLHRYIHESVLSALFLLAFAFFVIFLLPVPDAPSPIIGAVLGFFFWIWSAFLRLMSSFALIIRKVLELR